MMRASQDRLFAQTESSEGFKTTAFRDGDEYVLEEEETLPRATYRSTLHDTKRPPFRFSAHRTKLDWGVIYGIDPKEVVWPCLSLPIAQTHPSQFAHNDVDALDGIVAHLCYADLATEDPACLSAANFLKLFRLTQLIIEYLLFVQDTLSEDFQCVSQQKCDCVFSIGCGTKRAWTDSSCVST